MLKYHMSPKNSPGTTENTSNKSFYNYSCSAAIRSHLQTDPAASHITVVQQGNVLLYGSIFGNDPVM